jgi:hypothetical protein
LADSLPSGTGHLALLIATLDECLKHERLEELDNHFKIFTEVSARLRREAYLIGDALRWSSDSTDSSVTTIGQLISLVDKESAKDYRAGSETLKLLRETASECLSAFKETAEYVSQQQKSMRYMVHSRYGTDED